MHGYNIKSALFGSLFEDVFVTMDSFAIITQARFAYLSCNLSRQGRTGCPKLARGVSDEDKKTILNLHDQFRSEVARGAAKVGDITLPQAAAMAKMVCF
jgi:hypothetical protein